MTLYKITGVIRYVVACPCPDCDGHPKRWEIRRQIEAEDEADALERIASDWSKWPHDLDDLAEGWEQALTVSEVTEEQRMIALGQPMLFSE